MNSRRRRNRQSRFWHFGRAAALACGSLCVLALGGLILSARVSFEELTAGFPPVESIENTFGVAGRESFRPIRVYDRTGAHLLFEATPPAALGRQWHYIDAAAPMTLSPHTVQATIASLDEDFWSNPGYRAEALLSTLLNIQSAPGNGGFELTITQRLAGSQLVPLGGRASPESVRYLQSALLASELTRRYPKEKILEWYINSADFGRGAYGIDAAALVYFGKHATELSLGESAFLGAMLRPEVTTLPQGGTESGMLRSDVLQKMVELGYITEYEAEDARGERLEFIDEIEAEAGRSSLEEFILQELIAQLGESAPGRSGLRVISTIDFDLQSQSECLIESHLRRLSGEAPESTVPTREGATCLAAGLLPPMRPGDVGVDHRISDGAVLVLDSTTGEILGAVGQVGRFRDSGDAFLPFLYLTAFAQGYSPGTMVMDLPGEEDELAATEASLDGYYGPVRMRTALANLLGGAATATIKLVGPHNILQTARSMGVDLRTKSVVGEPDAADLFRTEASLTDLVFAMGVVGNKGVMVGERDQADLQPAAEGTLRPVVIREVEDATQQLVYRYEPQSHPILSPQLAFLMADAMRDEKERQRTLGPSNPLETGRPAGAITGSTPVGSDYWTLGFTPSRAVGVWVSGSDEEKPVNLTAVTGPAPAWHALLQYAVKDMPAEGWEVPPGVSELEVCDPSGMLPTEYCPNVVREVFIHGTEPTHADTLYKPFLVNRETGKLATLYTPTDLVEERVYLIPPAEAATWASLIGLDQPPEEYDTIFDISSTDPGVNISSPEPFDFIQGNVSVRGSASVEDMSFYRLQYGQGLNPLEWVQIGDDSETGKRGILAEWDTSDLSGLYTLQLIVVDQDGQLKTSAVHITVDNQPPEVSIVYPAQDALREFTAGEEVIIQASVEDDFGVREVMLVVDGSIRARLSAPPYSFRWSFSSSGEHEILVRAQDEAGNSTESEPLRVTIH